jgi:hypothetical protein
MEGGAVGHNFERDTVVSDENKIKNQYLLLLQ